MAASAAGSDADGPGVDWEYIKEELLDVPQQYKEPRFYPLRHVVSTCTTYRPSRTLCLHYLNSPARRLPFRWRSSARLTLQGSLRRYGGLFGAAWSVDLDRSGLHGRLPARLPTCSCLPVCTGAAGGEAGVPR